MTTTTTWTAQLASCGWTSLSDAERDAGRLLLADALGIAAAGEAADGVSPALTALAALGNGSVPVPWTSLHLPAPQAAFATSALVHAWDFDDTHDAAVVHALSVALPAALAAGTHAGRSGLDVLDGVVAGVQAISRLSLAIGAQRGMVRTAGLGAVAAAAAAARTLGLDAATTGHAMALALPAAGAPTSRQVVEDSAVSKRLQPGLAAQAGVTAAFLAAAGVTGPTGWLEGSYGLLALAADRDGAADVLLADGWEGASLSLKPYPACRYTHAAIAAAAALGVSAADVDRVEVHVPAGPAYELVSRPFARRGRPVVDAQFSIPWLVAAQLVTGPVDLTTIAGPALLDPDVEEVAARVVVHQDDPATSAMAPATVRAHLRAGGTAEASSPMTGSPEHPLTAEQVAAKAAACAVVAERDPSVGQQVLAFVDDLVSLPAGGLADALAALGRSAPAPHDTDRTTTPTQEKQWTSV